MCTSYDELGRLPSAGNSPQHYWQCSEVSILPSDPDAPIAPTAPVTIAPVVPVTIAPVVPNTVAPVVEDTPAPVVQDTTPTPVVQDTVAPFTSVAPVVAITLAPVVTDEPCTSGGECEAASGENQPECDNKPEQTCLDMIANEGKCAWTACENAPGK